MTGFLIKIIAIITMLIDHIGAVLYPDMFDFDTYYILRSIGRIAFPLFCFLIAEGAVYTHSIGKYILRLAIFSVISELPFNLALSCKLIDTSTTNVYFTLCLGLIAIAFSKAILVGWNAQVTSNNTCLNLNNNLSNNTNSDINPFTVKYYEYIFKLQALPMQIRVIITAIFLFLCAACAELLHTDYSICGVLMIYFMYFFRNHPLLRDISMAVLIFIFCLPIEFFGLISVIFMHLYNHKRGPNYSWIKYAFYVFYPLHLIILAYIHFQICAG